jgi:hypothetical protein
MRVKQTVVQQRSISLATGMCLEKRRPADGHTPAFRRHVTIQWKYHAHHGHHREIKKFVSLVKNVHGHSESVPTEPRRTLLSTAVSVSTSFKGDQEDNCKY